MRALRLAAAVEAVSLAVLLTNLATVHVAAVASLAGPAHGTAYLAAIACTWQASSRASTRWLAAIPGAGGLLALRAIRHHTPTDHR